MVVSDTSIKTYHEIKDEGLIGERQVKVGDYIFGHPDLTDTEIAHGMGYNDINKTRPRRRELVECGVVTENGKRQCTHTGRTAYVWRVKTDIKFVKPTKDALGEQELINILKKIDRATPTQINRIIEKAKQAKCIEDSSTIQKNLFEV